MLSSFFLRNRFQSSYCSNSIALPVRREDRIVRINSNAICVYRIVPPKEEIEFPQNIILFSKDPKIPISHLEDALERLSHEFHAIVYTYEYNTKEDDVMEDHYNEVTESVYQHIRKEQECFSNMIFIGQSLGCAPVLHLVSQANFLCPYNVSIVLIFPIQSLAHLIFPRRYQLLFYLFQQWLGFDNLSKIDQANYDLYLIHGNADSFITTDHSNGLYLRRAASLPKARTEICNVNNGTQENILVLEYTWTFLKRCLLKESTKSEEELDQVGQKVVDFNDIEFKEANDTNTDMNGIQASENAGSEENV